MAACVPSGSTSFVNPPFIHSGTRQLADHQFHVSQTRESADTNEIGGSRLD